MTTHWKSEIPTAPFYVVIFISRKGKNLDGYEEMDEWMMELAQQQPGYLGYSSVSKPDGGIFISYWKNEESIQKWREDSRHGQAKDKAKDWYAYYHSMISKVESSHIFEAGTEQML